MRRAGRCDERGCGEIGALLERFSEITVAVVGDVLYDGYLHGRARSLCREAPVPVVAIEERAEAAGGAANVAVNLAALGASVRLLSVVGDDDAAARVLDIARAHGVDVDGVASSPHRRTAAKRRILAGGQMLLRFDEGTEAPLDRGEARRLSSAVRERTRDADAVIASDYGMGVLTDSVVPALAGPDGPPLVVDAKDPARFARVRPLACTPNFDEAVALLGGVAPARGPDRAQAVASAAGRILSRTGATVAVVTLDADGSIVLERERPAHRVYAERILQSSSTGAGDTFTAAMALGLLASADAATAAEVASAAAAVVVGKRGTATCSPAELRMRLLPGGKVIADATALASAGDRHRREGRRIVLANGCFDILHRGHVALLNAAKRFGDVLVVAVNGDDSVRRLKGPSRPVNSLADRIEVLAALSCVDQIVPFHGDQPLELIRALRPDVLVKGGDYRADEVPEAPLVRALGGEVRIVAQVADRSTTRTLERLRAGAFG